MSAHACLGKQNARKTLNKSQGRWNVYWEDEITGKRKSSSYARWWWEINKGEIPDGYRVSFKDDNPLNIDPSNFILISPEEFGKSISERLMGHGFSEETLQKMSDAKKGTSLSEDHKKKIGKATKRMWKDGVFDDPKIREAYSKQGKATKGNKRTEEQKRRISRAKKGIKLPDKAYSIEAIEKRRKKLSGRHQSIESNQKRSDKLKGRMFSDEHLKKLSIASRKRVNDGTHNWLGSGTTSDPYPSEFGSYLKMKIRKRDGHVCQTCKTSVYKSSLGHVHHIDGNKQNCSEENLLLLCATCHNAVHGRNNVTNPEIERLKNLLLV